MTAPRAARALAVTGVVQGVGYRPFVHRLAVRYGLAGWVRNCVGEVEIHAEGDPDALAGFASALSAEAPPLARVAGIAVRDVEPQGHPGFAVLESTDQAGAAPALPPDVALCPACRGELADPGNRRAGYAFITCTDCGPRQSVVRALPYDRARTSMASFTMCPSCASEYDTPGDRRFRSETNSCPACGPRAWLEPAGAGTDALAEAARALRAGQVVAVRGMGGFHLAVDAGSEAAVRRLRERKGREGKPLAVMCASVAEAAALVHLDGASQALLESVERPIVLLPLRPGAAIAPSVAPGLGHLGVMLPSTPLHLLLLRHTAGSLVMTSGNLSDEPLAASNAEARDRLGGIADCFLMHDREVVSRIDDSVVRPAPGGPVFIRRARGYVPLPLTLPVATPVPLLAFGGQFKHTFTVASGRTAWVSAHQGDLDQLAALEQVRGAIDQLRALLRVAPAVAVHDLHPGYLSTHLAQDSGLRCIAVQHHHAHIAAVMAEHGETGPVVGLALDGTGHGTDGLTWGAEALVGDLGGMERVGQLRHAPLPGGDLAARNPWRALLGFLSLEPGTDALADAALASVDARERTVCRQQLDRRLNAPLASSMGRLFDAAACALGVRTTNRFEGQAAMELEALAASHQGVPLPFPLREPAATQGGRWVLDPVPLLVALLEGMDAGRDRGALAAGFHDAVAVGMAGLAMRAARQRGIQAVALGGGSFQNLRLLTTLARHLEVAGLRVLRARQLPPNDGGLSLGQAAVAAHHLAGEA